MKEKYRLLNKIFGHSARFNDPVLLGRSLKWEVFAGPKEQAKLIGKCLEVPYVTKIDTGIGYIRVHVSNYLVEKAVQQS